MSASKHVTVWCDHQGRNLAGDAYPGCFEFIEVGNESTVARARGEARAVGWRRVKGEDVCPACARALRNPVGSRGTDSGRTETEDG